MGSVVEREAAYVLHRRPFKESSLIVDVFSMSHGRVSLVVKGALKSKKQTAASLQVFRPLLLSWSGRSELKNLREVEVPSEGFSLKGVALYCGYYLNELLLNLCPVNEALPETFTYYASALSSLSSDTPPEIVLRHFEYKLLAGLGLAPELSVDSTGRDLDPQHYYHLSPDNTFLCVGRSESSAQRSGAYSGAAIVALKRLGQGEKLLYDEPSQDQNSTHAVEQKRLMRQLIDKQLYGRPLKSRDMIKQWFALKGQK